LRNLNGIAAKLALGAVLAPRTRPRPAPALSFHHASARYTDATADTDPLGDLGCPKAFVFELLDLDSADCRLAPLVHAGRLRLGDPFKLDADARDVP